MPDHFTTRLHLPYPDLDDPADVPADLQQLAEAIDVLSGISAPGGPGSPLSAAPVLDVGQPGQIRAGRQLTLADFATLCALPTVPVGLFNLNDLTNLGSGAPLVNKGAVPFGVGINGLSASAAVFAGSTGQALYIADTGAADPFRLKTGSWGCWFRTAKTSPPASQGLLAKRSAGAPQFGWALYLNVASATVGAWVSSTGSDQSVIVNGFNGCADDRWHQAVSTYDGTTLRLYVDGVSEGAGLAAPSAPIFAASGPLNIGGDGADGATATNEPYYGRVDEAFVTPDVLTEDQVRLLYCAKIAHALGVVPTRVSLNVRRRRRGGALAVADFGIAPVRLYNFTAGSLADEGSGGVALAVVGGGSIVPVAGAAGTKDSAYSLTGAHAGLAATDAGLPTALNPRTYGTWFKASVSQVHGLIGWGQGPTQLWIQSNTTLYARSGGDDIATVFSVCDGQWHQAVVVEDNAAGDGLRRKLYVDGRLAGSSTVLTSTALAGANRFRVGAFHDGSLPMTGQIDGAFVVAGALTADQVLALWVKGSQALAPSPKEVGAHVESMDAAAVYATFDELDTTAQVDLGVAA